MEIWPLRANVCTNKIKTSMSPSEFVAHDWNYCDVRRENDECCCLQRPSHRPYNTQLPCLAWPVIDQTSAPRHDLLINQLIMEAGWH